MKSRRSKKKGFHQNSEPSTEDANPIVFKKSMMEQVRSKIGQYVMSLKGHNKIDDAYVMRVKGKALNTFLGLVKTDMPRLAIEAFPEDINKKLVGLQLLKKCDLIWFDL